MKANKELEHNIEIIAESLKKQIISESKRFLSTGALDIEKYKGQPTALAKVLLHRALINESNYFCLSPEMEKDSKNLKNF